ncbi:MAG: hypothetical protein OEZ05_05415 [Nitrospirota bacterium]|nr:hypothetical protein [Nitrospirota bacterium]
MGRPTNIQGLKLLHDAQQPIIIYGSPGRVQGTLTIQNDSDTKLTVRSIPIQAPKLRSQTLEPLQEIRIFSRMYPSQQSRVTLDFPVDPSTPPGTYQATVLIGDQSQPVQIRISESVELEVEPDIVTVSEKDQKRFEREFVVTNVGNVPMSVGEKWVAALQGSEGMGSQVVQSMKAICQKKQDEGSPSREEGSVQEMLCLVANQQPGPVTLTWKNLTLAPGETQVMKGVIELPDGLQPHRHYFAEFELFSASLLVDIYTNR